VAVNAEQAEDWNGASGRQFIEQRERHERMLGRLTARLLAAAQIQDGRTFSTSGAVAVIRPSSRHAPPAAGTRNIVSQRPQLPLSGRNPGSV
jgi:hypothetical protein